MRGTSSNETTPWSDAPDRVVGLFAPEQWQRVYRRFDPYDPRWRGHLETRAGALARDVWSDLCKMFPAKTPANVVARNASIVLRRHDPSLGQLLEVVLRLAVPEEDQIEDVVKELRKHRTKGPAVPESHWLDILIGRADVEPHRRGVRGIAPDLALRWALAAMRREEPVRAAELLAIFDRFPDISRWGIANATREFLKHQTVTPLAAEAVEQLSPRIALLLAEQPDLRSALLGVSPSEMPASLREVQKLWPHYRELRRLGRLLVPALRDRKWQRASELAEQMLRLPWYPEVLDGLRVSPAEALRTPGAVKETRKADWPSKHKPLAKMLPMVAPESRIVPLLVTDPQTIAARAIRSSKYEVRRPLPTVDFAILQRLWDDDTAARLFRAGRFELVTADYWPDTLADLNALLRRIDQRPAKDQLRKWLADETRQGVILQALHGRALALRHFLHATGCQRADSIGFLVPFMGTSVTRGIVTGDVLENPAFLARAIGFWTQQSASAQKEDVTRLLARAVVKLRRSREFNALARALLALSPEVAQSLGRRVGAEKLADVLPPLETAGTKPRKADAELQTQFARALIAGLRPDDADQTWRVVVQHPKFVDVACALPWPEPGAEFTAAQLRMGILGASRDWRRTRQIATNAGEAAFREAVKDLKPLFPSRARELAYLELCGALPVSLHGALARAFGAMRFGADHGCALDHCYRTYKLPKKTSGNRTITVPPDWLRLLQRGIYDRILRPLGAHDAAHGFVTGRSIVTNARPHVGNAVVVNCDIASCFPSVRWSLVLAALRRDLGEGLAPATVSALVDLCCYQGGLPIGAPTSPALLNRVLLRTDTFLSEHARRRECHYTRYADDLTFSGDSRAVGMVRLAATSLGRIGLVLDEKKTNVYRGGRRQMVTGLVVNARVSVPRRVRRRMRAAVHAVERGLEPTWHGEPMTASELRGRLAFTRAVNTEETSRLIERLNGAVGQ